MLVSALVLLLWSPSAVAFRNGTADGRTSFGALALFLHYHARSCPFRRTPSASWVSKRTNSPAYHGGVRNCAEKVEAPRLELPLLTDVVTM